MLKPKLDVAFVPYVIYVYTRDPKLFSIKNAALTT